MTSRKPPCLSAKFQRGMIYARAPSTHGEQGMSCARNASAQLKTSPARNVCVQQHSAQQSEVHQHSKDNFSIRNIGRATASQSEMCQCSESKARQQRERVFKSEASEMHDISTAQCSKSKNEVCQCLCSKNNLSIRSTSTARASQPEAHQRSESGAHQRSENDFSIRNVGAAQQEGARPSPGRSGRVGMFSTPKSPHLWPAKHMA